MNAENKHNNRLNQDENRHLFNTNNTKWFGLLVIVIGIVLLLKNIPQTAHLLPRWIFSWPMILIVVGLYALIKHQNKNPLSWLIPLLAGVYFLLKTNTMISLDLDRFLLPAIIIIIGAVLFFSRNFSKFVKNQDRLKEVEKPLNYISESNTADYIKVNTTLGNAKKIVLSKKFKGGTVNCSFGGAEIDLTQADIQEVVVLNFSVIAGGIELLVPSNWEIQNNVHVVLGAIEDKRRRFDYSDEQKKVLVLEGNLSLGGLEIKN